MPVYEIIGLDMRRRLEIPQGIAILSFAEPVWDWCYSLFGTTRLRSLDVATRELEEIGIAALFAWPEKATELTSWSQVLACDIEWA